MPNNALRDPRLAVLFSIILLITLYSTILSPRHSMSCLTGFLRLFHLLPHNFIEFIKSVEIDMVPSFLDDDDSRIPLVLLLFLFTQPLQNTRFLIQDFLLLCVSTRAF